MTTPESLVVVLASQRSPIPRLFSDLRMIVIDAARRVLLLVDELGTEGGPIFLLPRP